MKCNAKFAMYPLHQVNILTWLWTYLSFSQVIMHNMSKYSKLTKIAMVQVIGSIENDKCFSNLNFIKSKFCNQLMTHLTFVVKMSIP